MPQKIQLATPYSLLDSPTDFGEEPKNTTRHGNQHVNLIQKRAAFITEEGDKLRMLPVIVDFPSHAVGSEETTL